MYIHTTYKILYVFYIYIYIHIHTTYKILYVFYIHTHTHTLFFMFFPIIVYLRIFSLVARVIQ